MTAPRRLVAAPLPTTSTVAGRGAPSRSLSAAFTRAGLLALPLYGALVAYATRTPQPDQVADPAGWARSVSSRAYLVEHLASTVLGTTLVVLGTIALGSYLASRVPRLALTGLVLSETGYVLLTVPGVVSTFATPAVGAAYLAGHEEVMALEFSPVLGPLFALALLLAVVGNVLLGAAVWRSGLLPRWSGVLWAVAAVVFYLLGAALGLATTGASLPTQPVGGALTAVAGAWLAWAARPGSREGAAGSGPAPSGPVGGADRPATRGPQHWMTRHAVLTGSAGARPES